MVTKLPVRFGSFTLHQRFPGEDNVFVATRTGEEHYATVKLVEPTANAGRVDAFFDLARTASRLETAEFPHVYEMGDVGGRYFIARVYVRGGDLHALLTALRNRNSICPAPLAAFIGTRICAGFSYAHTRLSIVGKSENIAHADFSARHVLMSIGGDVKLIGFTRKTPNQSPGRDLRAIGAVVHELGLHELGMKAMHDEYASVEALGASLASLVRASNQAELAKVVAGVLPKDGL